MRAHSLILAITIGAFCFHGSKVRAQSGPDGYTISTVILQEPGTIPHITLEGNSLVVAQGRPAQISVLALRNGTIVSNTVIPSEGGLFGIDTNNGWTTVCTGSGQKMIYFHAATPEKFRTLYLSPLDEMSCWGVGVEVAGGRPQVWMGSPDKQELFLVDLRKGQVLRRAYPASGVSAVKVDQEKIYAVNNILAVDRARPIIWNKATFDVVAGNPDGAPENTTFEREYNASVHLDKTYKRVFYVRPFLNQVDWFPTANPTEASLNRIDLPITQPKAVTRYGQCYAILGHTESVERKPQWTILKISANNSATILKTTLPSEDKRIWGSTRQGIDAETGDVYVAHWRGVSRIRGLFDGTDCGTPGRRPSNRRW
jgi:hypothetical protein